VVRGKRLLLPAVTGNSNGSFHRSYVFLAYSMVNFCWMLVNASAFVLCGRLSLLWLLKRALPTPVVFSNGILKVITHCSNTGNRTKRRYLFYTWL